MPQVCHRHCPPERGGLALLAAVVSSAALAAVISDVLVAVFVVLAVACAAGVAYLVHVLRREAGQVARIGSGYRAEVPTVSGRLVRELPAPHAALPAPRPGVYVVTDAPVRQTVRITQSSAGRGSPPSQGIEVPNEYENGERERRRDRPASPRLHP